MSLMSLHYDLQSLYRRVSPRVVFYIRVLFRSRIYRSLSSRAFLNVASLLTLRDHASNYKTAAEKNICFV